MHCCDITWGESACVNKLVISEVNISEEVFWFIVAKKEIKIKNDGIITYLQISIV